MNGLLIVGAGGHGKTVAEAAASTGQWDRIGFVDQAQELQDRHIAGHKVEGSLADVHKLMAVYTDLVVAIGDNQSRLKLLDEYQSLGFRLPVIMHRLAHASPSALIGEGTVLLAHSYVGTDAKIGRGCILNTGSSADHDNRLDDGVHLSPGARLGGQVKVGTCSWIGIGASVIHGVEIGRDTVVGAGAAVIRSLPDRVMAAGVPATIIKER